MLLMFMRVCYTWFSCYKKETDRNKTGAVEVLKSFSAFSIFLPSEREERRG